MSSRFDQFLKAGLYLRNWSQTTLRTYRQGLNCLRVETPTKPELDAWVIGLRQKGLTPAGANTYIRTINSYLTWLHEEGHAPARLRVKLLRAPQHQHTLLSPGPRDRTRHQVIRRPLIENGTVRTSIGPMDWGHD